MTTHHGQTTAIERRLRRAAWLLVISLGFVQAWYTRYNIEPDGISYLDIADKYLGGDWAAAVNSYWSPLYSWLLSAALFVFHPSAKWEYPVVHLLNFFIYLLAFICFEFLLKQIITYQEKDVDTNDHDSTLSVWCWQVVGYVLFLWGSLFLITISVVLPDMGVAALVFLLAGLLIQIRQRSDDWRLYVIFGVVLGLAYLTKAVMFPLGFVFLIVCFLWVGKWRQALPRVLVAATVFLLVSAPFIVALHQSKNRWTFSDTGKLAYAWFVDGIEPAINWQGNPPGSGQPVHPTRKLFDHPEVFAFNEPFAVTYPPWYDPTYWYEGVVSSFNVKGHLKVFGDVSFYFYAVLINSPIGMAVLMSFLIMTVYSSSGFITGVRRLKLWGVLLPSVASFALYSLVHMEMRYIGGFVVLFWLGLFSGIRVVDGNARKIQAAMMIALATTTLTVLAAKSIIPAYKTLAEAMHRVDAPLSERWRIAYGLRKLGLSPGEQIGSIGYGFGGIQYSARLAKLRIVAEITSGSDDNPKSDVDKFWNSSPEVQRKVIDVFASTGAKAIIANRLPPGLSDPPGWQRVDETDAYVYFLR